jgi:hypothetical protein
MPKASKGEKRPADVAFYTVWYNSARTNNDDAAPLPGPCGTYKKSPA